MAGSSSAKPTKGTSDELSEVERAISLLQGRHPEHERARREDEMARRRRAAELDALALADRKRSRTRRLWLAAIATPLLVVALVLAVVGRREAARRARIDSVAEPFQSHGFLVLATSSRGATGTLEVSAEPGCFLAVSTDTKALRIGRAGASVQASPPSLFCTCGSERISLSSAVGAEDGLALLRAETSSVGGSRAFAYAAFKPASSIVSDEGCREASLDAWLDAKRGPQVATSGPPVLDPLRDAGFHSVAHGEPGAPFVIANVAKESCAIVSGGTDDRFALRVKGQSEPIASGRRALGYCAQAEQTLVLNHEGAGRVSVVVGPAARVGGLIGLREVAMRAGVSMDVSVVPSEDRAWDAKQTLLASGIPEPIIATSATPDLPPNTEARIAAWSLETKGALTFELAENVHSSCAVGEERSALEDACVFSGPQRWRTPGGLRTAVGGLARAKLPFWLYALQDVRERLAIERIRKVLGVARALTQRGFAPTTLEAVVEQPNGVVVLGRKGEDAVVALGVVPVDPWVYTLSEDLPWDLESAPQIALVRPLEKVTLVTALKALPPIAVRRTVVFRRQLNR